MMMIVMNLINFDDDGDENDDDDDENDDDVDENDDGQCEGF